MRFFFKHGWQSDTCSRDTVSRLLAAVHRSQAAIPVIPASDRVGGVGSPKPSLRIGNRRIVREGSKYILVPA